MNVLYVEDDDNIRPEVARFLSRLFKDVDSAENGQVGLELYKNSSYDIVLSDISMPVMNGLEMSKLIRNINDTQEIIIISAYANSEYFVESIKIGVSGYILKPVDYDQMIEVLYQSAIKINALKEATDFKQHLIEMVEERTTELRHSIESERLLQKELIQHYEKTIFSFVAMVERRDTYTAGHSERVARYSKMIAEEMGYDSSECEKLYQASMLHDIGKVVIPDSVLLKPDVLNNLEYKLIQEHVSIGYDFLKEIPMYAELAEIIHSHHERYDGKGYPQGLKEDEIPPLSRIMLVADAFDAMTTNRIYKDQKSIEESLKELENYKGTQFHPDVVDYALKALKDVQLDKDVSQLPSTQLEEKRFAYFFKDPLTDLYSKSYLKLILLKNQETKFYQYMSALFIGDFTKYNAKYGWENGDKVLVEIAQYLERIYPNELVFRIYGDDFLILSESELFIDIEKLKNIDTIKNKGIIFETQVYKLDEINISSMDKLEKVLLR